MSAPWPTSTDQLRLADCLFAVDRVPGRPDVTEFKRRARWQQAWWREERGLPRGAHVVPGSGDVTPNGSRLDEATARDGRNFLSSSVRDAVRARLANPQPHQTLNESRLWGDLLSSMPMCFNLFGELHDDEGRLVAAVDTLWPDHGGVPDRVVFEW